MSSDIRQTYDKSSERSGVPSLSKTSASVIPMIWRSNSKAVWKLGNVEAVGVEGEARANWVNLLQPLLNIHNVLDGLL